MTETSAEMHDAIEAERNRLEQAETDARCPNCANTATAFEPLSDGRLIASACRCGWSRDNDKTICPMLDEIARRVENIMHGDQKGMPGNTAAICIEQLKHVGKKCCRYKIGY